MKQRFPALLALFMLSLPGLAVASDADTARVLLLGTFHFKDAGKDVVQVEDVDIFSEENQAYLEALTDRLADFEPTEVLLEYNPGSEAEINERYRQYRDGAFELPANEVYQLGFRIAKKAGLERVSSFDHREVQWAAQPLFEHLQQNEPATWEGFQALIGEVEADEARARATLDLAQLLARQNDPERDRQNMDLYLSMNAIGAGDSWLGANATASWWERNFRMYALVQKHATPGARIIAIGGSGHMAILKNLLATDQRLAPEDPLPYIAADPLP